MHSNTQLILPPEPVPAPWSWAVPFGFPEMAWVYSWTTSRSENLRIALRCLDTIREVARLQSQTSSVKDLMQDVTKKTGAICNELGKISMAQAESLMNNGGWGGHWGDTVVTVWALLVVGMVSNKLGQPSWASQVELREWRGAEIINGMCQFLLTCVCVCVCVRVCVCVCDLKLKLQIACVCFYLHVFQKSEIRDWCCCLITVR